MRGQLARTAVSILLASTFTGCGEQATTPRSAGTSSASRSKSPSPTTVNVTSKIFDADGAGNPVSTESDDFNGSGFATYMATGGVSSRVASDGGWQLLLANQSVRKLRMVFSLQGIPLPDGSYSADVEVFSACFDAAGTRINLLTMTGGEVEARCSFGVDFSIGRTKYQLSMGPDRAGSGTAMVTCNTVTNAMCSSWTIVPNASDPNAGAANLYVFGKGLLLLGTYHNSYSVLLN